MNKEQRLQYSLEYSERKMLSNPIPYLENRESNNRGARSKEKVVKVYTRRGIKKMELYSGGQDPCSAAFPH